MPSFNVENYIAESIQSVLLQSYQFFEVIVVDDGSTDRTREIVATIAERDARVLLISNTQTDGPAGARNCGVARASGEWLCFLDSDDLLAPDALSIRSTAIQCYLECDFFSSDFIFWYQEPSKESRKKTELNEVWRRYFARPTTGTDFVALDSPLDAFIETVLAWTGGVVLRRSLFQELGGFDESLPLAEDDHLWLRAAAASKQVVLILPATAHYRQRMTGITGGTGSLSPYAPVMFRKLLKDPLFSVKQGPIKRKLARHIYINCIYYREHGEKLQAIRAALQYWIISPAQAHTVKNLLACLLLRK